MRVLCLIIFLISGCATPLTGPDYASSPVPEVSDTLATLYLSRKDSLADFAGRKDIHVNGKKVLTLEDGGFTWINLKPGQYIVSAEVPWSLRPLFEKYNPEKISVSVVNGEIYHLHYNIDVLYKGEKTSVSFVGDIPIFTNNPDVSYKEYFSIVDKNDSESFLASYIYQKNNFKQ